MKFNQTAHKKLWKYLEDNPEMEKEDWPGWEWNGGKYEEVENDCFACGSCEFICKNCPLIWPENIDGDNVCIFGGIFDKWDMSHDYEKRASLAHQIANLPVKEGVETE